jgi:hypothetical protein
VLLFGLGRDLLAVRLSGGLRVSERLGVSFWIRERLVLLSGLGRGLAAFRVREKLVLLSGLGRDLVALRVRERLVWLSGSGRGLGREGSLSELLPFLSVCLTVDTRHARPGDPSDLIRCRNYVKSHHM